MTNRSETILPAASQVAADTGAVAAGSRLDRAIWAATDIVRRHWVFGLLLAAGLVLRVVAQLGYEPALLFIDSKKYIFGTDFNNGNWGSFDPLGYTLLVLRPVLMFADLAFVAVLQHVIGMAMAAALYVLMLRRGVTRWLAALAVAPVLLDAYQLNAEQTIMPDVLFEALLVAGIVLLLWQPRPGLAFVILGGLALGASAPVRQVGEALIVPALIYVLAAAPGWRTRLLHGAALTFCFALPVVGYMSYSAVILHYGFEMSNMGDAVPVRAGGPRGRLRHAEDPRRRAAAVPEPVGGRHPRRGRPGQHENRAPRAVPAGQHPARPADQHRAAAAPARLQRAGPAADAGGRRHRQGLGEDLRADPEHRAGRHPDLPLAVPGQLSVLPARHHPLRAEQRQQRVRPGGGGGYARVNMTAATVLRDYQLHGGYTPGPVFLLALLAGLAGIFTFRRRRDAGLALACLLITGTAVAVLLGADLYEFSWRYQLPALVTLPVAGAFGATAVARHIRARRQTPPTAAASRPSASWRWSDPSRCPSRCRPRLTVRTSACSPPASSTKTTGCACAGTRSSGATVRSARTRSSRRPTSRWSSRPRTTASTWSRSSATRSGGGPGRSRRAGSRTGRRASPEELARLELAQETGLRARVLVKLGYLHSAHGISSQGGHYFLATGLEPGPPEREAEEQDMRQAWVPRARFEEMISEGAITDDSTVAAYALLLLSERSLA